MSLLFKIKQAVWNYHFQKEFDKLNRERGTYNLTNARRVGLVYDASYEAGYKKASDFVRYLQKMKIIVKALGYYKSGQLPHYCIPMLSYDFFSNKDINWFDKPSSRFINDFIKEKYDIVIDLNLKNSLSSTYIVGLSRAKCKVGMFDEGKTKIYDFMIKLEDKTNLNEFIKQVIHYLTILKTEKDAK